MPLNWDAVNIAVPFNAFRFPFASAKPPYTDMQLSLPNDWVIGRVLPPFIATAIRHGLPGFDRLWKGRFLREAVLVGPKQGAVRGFASSATMKRGISRSEGNSIRLVKVRDTRAAIVSAP